MRTKRRSAAVTLVLVAALAATGCTPEAPRANEKPTPTSTPLFASDEEALAAAEEAYATYLAVVDRVLGEGGSDPDRLRSSARGEALEQAIADANEFNAKGYRTTGTTSLQSTSLQFHNAYAPDGEVVVRAYVCEDVSQVDLLGKDGTSLVSPARPDLTPFEAAFIRSEQGGSLVVSSREVWGDVSVCD
jgi:hypothetical protein